jgi:hypothetical protein
MTAEQLIKRIQGDKAKLSKWFEDLDGRNNSINDFQTLLGYPLEPHSYRICHKIRHHILSGVAYQFHHKLPSLAKYEFDKAIDTIKKGEPIRVAMNEVEKQMDSIFNS